MQFGGGSFSVRANLRAHVLARDVTGTVLGQVSNGETAEDGGECWVGAMDNDQGQRGLDEGG